MAALDAAELLHLGLHASQHDDPAKAIDYLKQCLALQPDNASATYLLGALYAQIGIYDRATDMLTRAVDLDGNQTTAVFQLGLLHLTSGHVAEASRVWERLDALPADNFLNLFRHGLLALARDDFEGCISLLDRGIAANELNEALNVDMRNLEAVVQAARDRSGHSAIPESQDAGRGEYLLGSYRQKNRH